MADRNRFFKCCNSVGCMGQRVGLRTEQEAYLSVLLHSSHTLLGHKQSKLNSFFSALLAHEDNKRPVRQLKEVGNLLKLLAHTHTCRLFTSPPCNLLIKVARARRKSLFLHLVRLQPQPPRPPSSEPASRRAGSERSDHFKSSLWGANLSFQTVSQTF